MTVDRLNQYISSSHPGHLSELKYRLKLFSEAALCSKEIYKIFEEGGLDKEGFVYVFSSSSCVGKVSRTASLERGSN